jgi:UDP-N-acetylmuramate--alanine ligase
MQPVHFIGIGGVGMNGLAQLAVMRGFTVTGSDRAYHPEKQPFTALEKLGIRMVPQDGTGIDAATGRVVYSSAIEADNPDLVSARARHIPLLHRAGFLRELIGGDTLIAVAGTAGKTTTAGLLGWIFECLGMDPNVYNGAAVLNWKSAGEIGNVRSGSSSLWIIEADESDRSFLCFHPSHAILTNIFRDHFELDELNRMFGQFEAQTSGLVIKGEAGRGDETWRISGRDLPPHLLGRHNLDNADCAVRLCRELGMDMDRVYDAIQNFRGIERRLEVVGEAGGITVIDDYAHNPAKISAALQTAAENFPAVHAYWRPHGFTPFFQARDELTELLKAACPESLFILPVYYAGGTVNRRITSAQFVADLNSAGIPARYVKDYAILRYELEQRARPGDAVLGMGARDPELPYFARQLVTEWKPV